MTHDTYSPMPVKPMRKRGYTDEESYEPMVSGGETGAPMDSPVVEAEASSMGKPYDTPDVTGGA